MFLAGMHRNARIYGRSVFPVIIRTEQAALTLKRAAVSADRLGPKADFLA